jgi:hypothetical protein
MSQHVFISYAHADSEIAHKIATDLEEGGISVWIDVQGLAPGTRIGSSQSEMRLVRQKQFCLLHLLIPDNQFMYRVN